MKSHVSTTWASSLSKRLGLRCLMLLGSLGLYGLAFRDLSMAMVLGVLGQFAMPAVGVLCGLNLAIIWSMCLRWSVILKQLGHPVTWYLLCAYRMCANAVSYLTPGPHFGGEPVQMCLLKRYHLIPKDKAVASVAIDRLIELGANLGVLFLTGMCLFDWSREHSSGLLLYAAGFVAAVFMLLIFFIGLARQQTPLTNIISRLHDRLKFHPRLVHHIGTLKEIERTGSSILKQSPATLMVYAGGAFLQWLFIIAEFWFIYHVAGMPLDILQLVYLVGAARLAFLLPLPGGIGALEASQIMVMSGLGLEPAIGMTACVVMRIRDLAVVGVGSALAIYWFSSDNKHMDKT